MFGDPISLGISAIGLGLQVFGGFSQAAHAKQNTQLSKQMVAEEAQVQALKQQQMELEGRRMQTENIRNIQRGRAMAVQSGVNQGAQFGSGLAGGLAQVQNQGFWNMMGVSQGLEIGRGIAGHNQNISGIKQQMSDVQGQMATDQGYQSLGGALLKAGPFIGQVSQGFGGSSSSGDYTGNPWSKNTGNIY